MSRCLELGVSPTVGRTYLVPAIGVAVGLDDEMALVPYFGHPHSDEDIGGLTDKHVHVDRRFISDERLAEIGFDQGCLRAVAKRRDSCAVVVLSDQASLTTVEAVCVRSHHPHGQNYRVGSPARFKEFVLALQAKGSVLDTVCGLCPHKGTSLVGAKVVNGRVTCPAHGMAFKAKTGLPVL